MKRLLTPIVVTALLALTSLPAAAMSPEADALLASAIEALESGEADAAYALASQAVVADPGAVHAHLLRGSLARERGDLELAVSCFREAHAAAPENVGALMELGTTESWRGRYEAALSHYGAARELATDNPEPSIAFARVLSWSGRNGEAAELLGEVMADHPTHVGARLTAARVEAARSRPGASVALYEAVLQLDPENSDAAHGLRELREVRPRSIAATTELRRVATGETALGWNIASGLRLSRAALDLSYGMVVPDLKPENDGSVDTSGVHTARMGVTYQLTEDWTVGAAIRFGADARERSYRLDLNASVRASETVTVLASVTPGHRTDGGGDFGGNAGLALSLGGGVSVVPMVFAYTDFRARTSIAGAGRVNVRKNGWLAEASGSVGMENGRQVVGFGGRVGRRWRSGRNVSIGYGQTRTFFVRHTVSLTLEQSF